MMKEKQYWFPRKTHGWGWDMPTCWQGGVVLICYLLLITIICTVFSPYEWMFYGGIGALSLFLLGICLWKGEPPKGQWEEKEKKD